MGRILERWRKIDGMLRAGGWAWVAFCWVTGLTGAAVVAWASSTWIWFWTTFNWFGVAAAFLTALLILSISFLLIGLAVRALRRPGNEKKLHDIATVADSSLLAHNDEFGLPTITQSAPTLAAGLYVTDIRFAFDDLEKNRRAELTMRVFNGAGRAVEFSTLSGQLTFSAPNSTDPEQKGTLPTPTLRHDVPKISYPLQEWFFILEQRVPAQEADKMIAMIAADVAIHFDLTRLDISVFPKGEPKKVERLPLWGGLSCHHGICFGRIIHAVFHIGGVSTG
jgi:hypothetical protein